MKLTASERKLLFITLCSLILLLYWYFLFDPTLAKISRLQAANEGLERQLIRNRNVNYSEREKINVKNKEEQVSELVNFIDQKFRQLKVNLVAINQVSENNKITIDLKFSATYAQLLELLNLIDEIETLAVFDNVVISQQGGHLNVTMRVLSGYL
ncbi:MAG: hypothetical protein ABIH50_01280 [bacterium]